MEIQVKESNEDELRERFRKMSDKELIEAGKTLRFLTDEKGKRVGHNPFILQLRLAVEEWRRRYPKT